MDNSAETSSGDSDVIEQPMRFRVEHAPRVNFALQQNDVPVIREVIIENLSTLAYDDLNVTIQVGCDLSEPWQGRIARIGPGEVRRLQKIDLRLDPVKLANQLEREKVDLTAKVDAGGSILAEWRGAMDVMAFNEWPGTTLLPEILAAFVTPNHPSIDALLKRSSDILKQESGDPSFAGYQIGGPGRVEAQIGAIYQAMRSIGVRYVSPPASYEVNGQKIRSPDQVLDGRQGACLDLSVVIAATIEQAGLHPLLLLVEGHAFAGVWLQKDHFNDPSIEDATRILNRVRLGEILVFEVTALTDGKSVDFPASRRLAEDRLADTATFLIAVDIKSARASGIRPLPARVASGHGFNVAVSPDAGMTARLEPGADGLRLNEAQHTETIDYHARLRLNRSSQSSASDLPKAAQDRVARWKRNLLDLTRRNSLLNFHPARRIVLLGRDLALLEDGLASGSGYELRPRFDLFESSAPRDLQLERDRSGRDIPEELLRTELKRRQLCVDLSESDFDKRLVKLYREAKSSIEETGTNTLFLAVGGLIWRESGSGAVSSEAPLILIPVQIERPGPRRYRLRILDDDTRINETLVEMLRQDFRLPVENLTSVVDDASGIDVDRLFKAFRELIKDIPGWEVKENASLGLFSFAKFMLWTDLEERFDQVLRSPIVKHLMTRPDRPFSTERFPDASTLDYVQDPEAMLCPLDADSSQLRAVQAALAGNTFVLQGPPGTGKSQTITNLIARALADGKRVLFVAEKMAALSVVQRRLEKAGLGPFLLELHSAKAGKREVLAQIRGALDATPPTVPDGWRLNVNRLCSNRDHLNGYVAAMHVRRPSGESVFEVIGRLALLPDTPRLSLNLGANDLADVSPSMLESLRRGVAEIAEVAATIGDLANHPLAGIQLTHCGLEAPGQLLVAIEGVRNALSALGDAVIAWGRVRDLPITFLEDQNRPSLSELAFLSGICEAITGWQSPSRFILTDQHAGEIARLVEESTNASSERNIRQARLRANKTEGLLKKDIDNGKMRSLLGSWLKGVGISVDDARLNQISIREFRMLSSLPIVLAEGVNHTQGWLGLRDWRSARDTLLRAASIGRRRDELREDLTQKHPLPFFSLKHAVLLQSLTRSIDLWCDVLQVPQSRRPDPISLRVDDLVYLARIARLLLESPASAGILLSAENWEGAREQLASWTATARRALESRAKLSARYQAEFFESDHTSLSQQARAAQMANWMTRWLKRRQLHKVVGPLLKSDPMPSEQELIRDLQAAAQTRADENVLKDAAKEAVKLLGRQWKEAATDWGPIERAADWVTKFRKLVNKAPAHACFDSGELIGYAAELLDDDRNPLLHNSPERISLLDFVRNVEAAGRQLGKLSIDVYLLADLGSAAELDRHNAEIESLALQVHDAIDLLQCPNIASWETIERSVNWVGRVRQITGDIDLSNDGFIAALLRGAIERKYLVDSEPVRNSLNQLARRAAELLAQAGVDGAEPDACLLEDIDSAKFINALEAGIDAAGKQLAAPVGFLWKGVASDWTEIKLVVDRSRTLRALISNASNSFTSGCAQSGEAILLLACSDPSHPGRQILENIVRAFVSTKTALATLAQSAGCESWQKATDKDAPLIPQWEERMDRWERGVAELREWCQWQTVRQKPENKPLQPLLDAIESGAISHPNLSDVFEKSYGRAWLSEVISKDSTLSNFTPERQDKRVAEFRDEDRHLIEISRQVLSGRLHARMNSRGITLGGGTELATLKRELGKQKRHLPVRKLIQQLPSLLPRVKPCWLMSPLSVAQYLDPKSAPFDLVVFDEASQIPVWDAVGALARGTHAIVVGDSKQLPPTNFFQREGNDDPVDEGDSEELESILDECVASGIPELSLKWHYRSRHESLIAFSNRHYYGDRLFTFPSADGKRKDRGVSLRKVNNGIYDRGRKRTNEVEARAIVAEVMKRIKSGDQRSLGIVTFSQPQQELVENLLDEERQRFPELEQFFVSSQNEPIFVKNLENVQGDERDVILFSICYGPDKDGAIWMSFGALNNPGGERRLNVAITRAREQVVVFASINADQIDLGRSRATGVAHLRAFLEYAERGAKVLDEIVTPADGMSSSSVPTPFEDSVRRAIQERGWAVEPRVGCSGYRIDLGVKDPDSPDRYLLGIECDGENYRTADTARDRDRLRNEVLTGLGWKLHRVWSSDWLHDAAKCVARIEKQLIDLSSLQV